MALPAPPGRTHDLTAARTHRIIRIRERQGVPIVVDFAYQRAGLWLTTGIKRRSLKELTPTEKTVNHALAAPRAPVEPGVARLNSCRVFRRSRCSPNRMTSIAKAVPPWRRNVEEAQSAPPCSAVVWGRQPFGGNRAYRARHVINADRHALQRRRHIGRYVNR